MEGYVIGVDVGTGSARAGLFTLQGVMLASSSEPIEMWRPLPEYAEQSSDDIWRAVCSAVRRVTKAAAIEASRVAGISYDATSSLVALDSTDRPVSLSPTGDTSRNIIVWMDHRALADANAINAGSHSVLRYVGGKVSPEMETPKLRWIKANLPSAWSSAARFMDLADFLCYRSTAMDVRSLCTMVCKWTYLGHEGEARRWDRDFLRQIGLEDAFDGKRVVDDVRPMGSRIGTLTLQAANELGLTTGCAVGVGIIDAHAGGLGVLGSIWNDVEEPDLHMLETALALIGGTSSCHMAVSAEPHFIEGIWGPYYGAMVPGMWLTEGGQSSAGSAIDFLLESHPNAKRAALQAADSDISIYELLNREIERLARENGCAYTAQLTRNLHVQPDLLGNRSPHADPYSRGVIDGISLDPSVTGQALQYYAAVQAVAYGTRDIVNALNSGGYRIGTLLVTGGGTKNPVWLQEHADATGLTLVLPREPEAVLLGAAVLAAAACGAYNSVPAAMKGMAGTGDIVTPNPAAAGYHTEKFAIYCDMYAAQKHRSLRMAAFAPGE